jgi:hypothetical protein
LGNRGKINVGYKYPVIGPIPLGVVFFKLSNLVINLRKEPLLGIFSEMGSVIFGLEIPAAGPPVSYARVRRFALEEAIAATVGPRSKSSVASSENA